MNDWESFEELEPTETDEQYYLRPHDKLVVSKAIVLLEKIIRAPFIRPAEIVSVAKALHVLKRLPRITDGVFVSVSLTGPRRWFNDREEHEIYHWWEVSVDRELVNISSGGHFYRQSTGGDSFTSMTWSAEPGFKPDFSDYLHLLQIVDDAQPFQNEVDAIDLSLPGYSLEVTDNDNSWLEDLGADEESEEDVSESDDAPPSLTEAERRLMTIADVEEGLRQEQYYLNPSDNCGLCDSSLEERHLFVDGCLRGQLIWSIMCAECFSRNGEGIGWGKGQLYQRQADGDWLMIAGFRPEAEA